MSCLLHVVCSFQSVLYVAFYRRTQVKNTLHLYSAKNHIVPKCGNLFYASYFLVAWSGLDHYIVFCLIRYCLFTM